MPTVKELQAQLNKLTTRRDSLIDFRNNAIVKKSDNPANKTNSPDKPNRAEVRASKSFLSKLDAAEREGKIIQASIDKTKEAIKKREAMLKIETSKLLKKGRGGGGNMAGNPTIDMGGHKVRLVKNLIGR